MRYDVRTAHGAAVIELDREMFLRDVCFVDTDAKEVGCVARPIVVNKEGTDIERYTIRFTEIRTVMADDKPAFFYCSGRIK